MDFMGVILELRTGLDVDKPNVYIDDCISRMEPIHKVIIDSARCWESTNVDSRESDGILYLL